LGPLKGIIASFLGGVIPVQFLIAFSLAGTLLVGLLRRAPLSKFPEEAGNFSHEVACYNVDVISLMLGGAGVVLYLFLLLAGRGW
jgi:hypothetical protein